MHTCTYVITCRLKFVCKLDLAIGVVRRSSMLALIMAMPEKDPDPEPPPKKAKTESMFDVLMNSGESRFECVRVKEGHQDMLCDQVTDAISDSCLAEDPKSKEKCASATKDNKDAAMDEITTLLKWRFAALSGAR